MRRLISIILLLSASWTVDGQITVGGSTSSILSLNSTSQGVLTPRMTKADRLGIISPAIGLLVYQTDEVAGFYFYGGQGWKSLNASAISIQDGDQDSKVQVEETPDDDIVRIDLGGTEVVTFKNNNFSGSRIEFPANNGNVFMGNLSGRLAIGTDNLLIGDSVGYTNIGGSFNLGLGTKSLFANLNGQANLAIGKHALLSSVADSNMAIGIHALTSNTTGKLNTAIGYNALTQNTVGNTNTAIGYSLYRNQTGSANTVIGYEAMSDNTTGSDNTIIGDYGSHRSTSASSNTIVNDASSTETMLNNLDGSENAIAGTRIIRDGTSISQTTAMGHDVMRFMTGGINNLAIGNKAMFGNNTGDSNVGIGNEAMSVFDAGTKNTIIGQGTEFSSVQDGHNITAVYIDTTGTEFENMNGTIIGFENSEGGGPNHTIIGQGISLPSYTGHHSHTVIGSLDIYPVVSNVITLGGINSRVGIGTTNPHPSAIMDVKSTTKGMLFPRIDKESISPGGRTDLLIYDSIRNAFYKSVDEPGQWRWHNLNNMFDNDIIAGDTEKIPVWDGTLWDWSNTQRIEDIDGNSNMRISDDGKFVIKLDGTDRFRMTSSSNKLMIEPLANNNSLYFGNNAGLNANTSDYNTAIGYNTLKNVGLSGNYNTAFGSEALTTNTTGSYNTAVGRNALKNNVNGNGNTAIGANSMFAFTSGNNNTAFGFRSLNDCIDGDFNTALGNNSDVSSIGISYGTAIGPRSMVTQSHSMVLGSIAGINGAVESVKVGFAASNPQAVLHVRRFAGGSDPIVCIEEDALDFSRIRFKNTNSSNEWSINGKAAQMDADARFNFRYTQDILSLRGDGDAVLAGVLTQTSDKRLKKNIKPIQFHPSVLDSIHAYHYYWKDENRSNKLQLGFLAQEVENIYPHLVNENEGVKGLNYTGFVPLLIEGVKVQDKQNQALETRLLSIHKELLNLTTTLNQFK